MAYLAHWVKEKMIPNLFLCMSRFFVVIPFRARIVEDYLDYYATNFNFLTGKMPISHFSFNFNELVNRIEPLGTSSGLNSCIHTLRLSWC